MEKRWGQRGGKESQKLFITRTPTIQVFKLTLFALWYLSFTSATVLPYNSIIRLGKPLRNIL